MSYLTETLPRTLEQAEWIGSLVARLAVGLLFVISGFGKLFNSEKRQSMRKTLDEAKIPLPRWNAVFVAGVEFVCGGLLLIGLLTPLACALLICTMLVAIATVKMPEWQGSLSGWLGELLYLPEVMYVVILIWLFLAGPGWLSLDYLLRRQAALG